MKCKYCNSEIEGNERFCPYCGREVVHDNRFEPNKSGRSSKTWLWILGVILLFGIIGGGWFFLNDNQAPEVGTLTAYYAKEDFRVNEHEYKKGVLICDSNDPLNHVSDEDENNYRYSGDDGGEDYSWLLPKSKVEKKVYTMNLLAPSDIDRKAYFEADNGCVARIFWSNSNGHRFYNWNGKEEKYNEEERYKECFVLSAELLSPWDDSKYLFEEQLNEKSGYIELYCENKYRQPNHLIGFVEESWYNKEGYDSKKSAYDKDGKLLVDQWEIDGIPDYISIAYIADEDALYINGILYYLREESLEASDSEITTTEPVISIADILGTNGKISLLVKSHGFKEQTYISGRGAECHYYYKNCVIEDDNPVPVDKNTAVCIDCTYGIDGEETIMGHTGTGVL